MNYAYHITVAKERFPLGHCVGNFYESNLEQLKLFKNYNCLVFKYPVGQFEGETLYACIVRYKGELI